MAPQTTLRKLGPRADGGDVADFGCGYGTFTAKITRGIVHAGDKANGEPKAVTPITHANADETKLWLEDCKDARGAEPPPRPRPQPIVAPVC